MAVTVKCTSNQKIELADYVEWVKTNVDLADQESIFASAPMLYALSLNRSLMVDVICSSLKASICAECQPNNPFFDTTLLLTGDRVDGRNGIFYVRAVVWTTATNRGYSRFAHDHHFNFVTVGYFGPGYRTSIYEYDPRSVQGYIGEHVDLDLLEDTTLTCGKVMAYRRGVDVHRQRPPKSLSISLNLMVPSVSQAYVQQYEFDVEKQCIQSYVPNKGQSNVSLVDLAGAIGDGNTADILYDIARLNPGPRTRLSAYQALYKLLPAEREKILSDANGDKAPLVGRLLQESIFMDGSPQNA